MGDMKMDGRTNSQIEILEAVADAARTVGRGSLHVLVACLLVLGCSDSTDGGARPSEDISDDAVEDGGDTNTKDSSPADADPADADPADADPADADPADADPADADPVDAVSTSIARRVHARRGAREEQAQAEYPTFT